MRIDGRARRWAGLALAVGLAVALAGCGNPLYRPNRVRYSYELTMTQPAQSTGHSYEDDAVAIRFRFFETEIAFNLRNKTNRLLTVFWDESRYVTETGAAKRVFHKGIRVRNRFKPQPPTVIPARADLDDHVVPSDNVLGGIIRSELIPILPVWDYEDEYYFPGGNTSADRAAERRRAIAASLDGRPIGLDLAMEVNEKKKTYRFRFLVKVIRK